MPRRAARLLSCLERQAVEWSQHRLAGATRLHPHVQACDPYFSRAGGACLKSPREPFSCCRAPPDLHIALVCTHRQSQRCRLQAATAPPAASGAQPGRPAARRPACHGAAVCRWHQDYLEWRAREHARLRQAGLLDSGDEASSEEGGSPRGRSRSHSPRRLQGEADRALVRRAGVTLEQRAREEARHDARKVSLGRGMPTGLPGDYCAGCLMFSKDGSEHMVWLREQPLVKGGCALEQQGHTARTCCQACGQQWQDAQVLLLW